MAGPNETYKTVINTVKKPYYQYVKPNIDKVMTNPLTAGLVGGIPAAIGSYFYKPDFDARDAKSKNEAYKMARSTGAKTFIWNGNKYNTDYKGNPKKTLVQQKQEELDTYGITNEQTQNKSKLKENLHQNLIPYSYAKPVLRVIKSGILGIEDDIITNDKNDKYMYPHIDAWNLYNGYPQKHNTFGISKYKPTINTDNKKSDYYYKLNEIDATDGYNVYTNEEGISSNDTPQGGVLGGYTIGLGKNYKSYYDKWDLDPFGSGNDKPLYQLGKPLNIYDRKYFKK